MDMCNRSLGRALVTPSGKTTTVGVLGAGSRLEPLEQGTCSGLGTGTPATLLVGSRDSAFLRPSMLIHYQTLKTSIGPEIAEVVSIEEQPSGQLSDC